MRELTSLGIQPEILLCRCERPLPDSEREKIALFCNVRKAAVIPALDARNIYAVPRNITRPASTPRCCARSASPTRRRPTWPAGTTSWTASTTEGEVTIGVVGKYVGLQDAYKSLTEALVHGGLANRVKVNIQWLDAELFEHPDAELAAELEPMHGILVPGGFGERGSEGKIASVPVSPASARCPSSASASACRWPASKAARNTAGIAEASTTEFGETREPVVGLITEWMSEEGLQKRAADGDLGGTMRLGAYPAMLGGNSVVRSIYGTTEISERHRHRYEVNVHYHDALEKGGLVFSGMSPTASCPRSSSGRTIPGSSACSSTRN